MDQTEIIRRTVENLRKKIQWIIANLSDGLKKAAKEMETWNRGTPPTEEYEFWGRCGRLSDLVEVLVREDDGVFIAEDIYHIDENGGTWWEYGDKVIAWREMMD